MLSYRSICEFASTLEKCTYKFPRASITQHSARTRFIFLDLIIVCLQFFSSVSILKIDFIVFGMIIKGQKSPLTSLLPQKQRALKSYEINTKRFLIQF